MPESTITVNDAEIVEMVTRSMSDEELANLLWEQAEQEGEGKI